jgi:hypothetical protein
MQNIYGNVSLKKALFMRPFKRLRFSQFNLSISVLEDFFSVIKISFLSVFCNLIHRNENSFTAIKLSFFLLSIYWNPIH